MSNLGAVLLGIVLGVVSYPLLMFLRKVEDPHLFIQNWGSKEAIEFLSGLRDRSRILILSAESAPKPVFWIVWSAWMDADLQMVIAPDIHVSGYRVLTISKNYLLSELDGQEAPPNACVLFLTQATLLHQGVRYFDEEADALKAIGW